MRKKVANPIHSIQRCSCGTIRIDLGNISLKYDKDAFLMLAASLNQAAQRLEAPGAPTTNVVALKSLRPNP